MIFAIITSSDYTILVFIIAQPMTNKPLSRSQWIDHESVISAQQKTQNWSSDISHDIKTVLDRGNFSIEELYTTFHQAVDSFRSMLVEKYHVAYEELKKKRADDPIRWKVLTNLTLLPEEKILENMMLPLEQRVEETIRILVNRPEERIQDLIVTNEQKLAMLESVIQIHNHNISDWTSVPFKLESPEMKYAMQTLDENLGLDDSQKSRYLFELLADAWLLGTPQELEELRNKIDELNSKIRKFKWRDRYYLWLTGHHAFMTVVKLTTDPKNGKPEHIWINIILVTLWILYLYVSHSGFWKRLERSNLKRKHERLEERDSIIRELVTFNYQGDTILPYELWDNLSTERLEEVLASNQERLKNYKTPDDRTKFREMLAVMNPSIDEKEFEKLWSKISKEAEAKKMMPIPQDLLPDSMSDWEIKQVNKETLEQLGLDKKQAENFATELQLLSKKDPSEDTLDLNKFDREKYRQQLAVKEKLKHHR